MLYSSVGGEYAGAFTIRQYAVYDSVLDALDGPRMVVCLSGRGMHAVLA